MNVHGNSIKIFSCNSNPKLAEAMAKKLGIPLGDMTVSRFADGEISISIKETVRGADVFVVQSTCSPVNDNLMELLISIDAFKRASAGRITAVIPYYGYGRQDRKAKPRDPISAKLVADLLTAAGADRVLTMDLHALQIQGFFNMPVDHLVGVPLYVKDVGTKFSGIDPNDIVVVSPDIGSVIKARNFAQRIGTNMAIVDKRRQEANKSEVMNIIGDVEGKICIMVDDIVDTAGTICNAAEALVEKGGAKEVYVYATHGVLSPPALERIENSKIKEMVLTDTIPLVENTPSGKIRIMSVAGVFAETINRIYYDRSVSPLVL